MKVDVLTTCSRKSGGLFYSVRGLAGALESDDCRCRIFSPSDEFSKEDRNVWSPLPVELYSAYGPLRSSLRLRTLLAESGGELIHVHGIWQDAQWAALQRQKKTSLPVVISPRGMLDPWALKNRAWKKKIVGELFAYESLRRATCIHALCRSEAESIRAQGYTNPVALIPNGVELPAAKTPEVRDGKKRLLFLGRIHPKKGLAELLTAWGKAGASWRDEWELIIAGWDDGGHEAGLKQMASDFGKSVSFCGPCFGEEKEWLLRTADAFILPSFSEGLPMSVLEAMAYSLPVLMTEFCNIPEGFDAGASIRIEPDAISIAKGLDELQSMPAGDRIKMGAKGRELVERRFTWSVISRQMKQVYEWCVNGGQSPDCLVE